ncbi:Ig-like domain-containing protein [Clostridium magnum]|nr:Ig-like domain-containing protein [Clostridium magnum]
MNKKILIFLNVLFWSLLCPFSLVFASNNNADISYETINTSHNSVNLLDIEANVYKNQTVAKEMSLDAKLVNSDIINNVSLNKKWTIKFSQPIDTKSTKNKVKILDKDKKEIPITVSFEEYNLYMYVTPNQPYNPDSEYALVISDLLSKHNKKLETPLNLAFKTGPIIRFIEDIDVSINQEDEYRLPDKVNASMSNGRSKLVAISWDKFLKSTSIPGKYTYSGKVEGYEKSVILSLDIKAFEPVKSISNSMRTQSQLQTNLYNYMMNKDNRDSVMNRAIELHNGDLSNNCVYFSSEALRRVGLSDLPESVCNTSTLTQKLKSYGWNLDYDLSKLLPGDICFTTSIDGSDPSHAYIFMKWVDPNSFNYGYICDNQGDEYGNSYHKRNIDFATESKEALSYFLYIP